MAGPARKTRAARPVRRHAETVFFPLAAGYGALAIPLSVHGMLSGQALLPGYASVYSHAHELLFGYALAVVTGFLVTRASPVHLSALVGLWLLARITFVVLPGSAAALLASLAFAVLLLTLVVPGFARGAKKLRNQAFAPLLIALALAGPALQWTLNAGRPGLGYVAVQAAVLLFTLLMLFMGGRMIAPAAAGAIARAGGHLEARVQPRFEAALLVLLALAVAMLPWPGARPLAGAFLLVAAGVALVRLLRWQLWRCRARPDLWCLGVGYGWLAVGLLLFGLAWTTGIVAPSAATHAITVGALGTLTTASMARVRLTRRKEEPAGLRPLPWIAAAMSAAALLRIWAHGNALVLGAAAACWSLALLLLLGIFIRRPPRT